jgi:transcriptional regulator GlxA family with amidase domain
MRLVPPPLPPPLDAALDAGLEAAPIRGGRDRHGPPRRRRGMAAARPFLPVAPTQQLEVVNRAGRYFARHFAEDIQLEVLATSIGVSAEWLDLCFDHCRGKTPFQALQHFRLSRLFEGIAEQPQTTLQQQVHRCGLASVMAANRLFEELFGIGLAPFRRVCRQAAADRLLHRHRR